MSSKNYNNIGDVKLQRNYIKETLILLVATFIFVAIDQATKCYAIRNITPNNPMIIIENFFEFTFVLNPGAAFGLFTQGPAELRLGFFIAIALFAVFVILSFFRQLAPGDHTSALGLGLILGGAIGNLIDRIARKEVIDFLHFRLWGGRTWPDFNLADAFIIVGVVILLIELLASEAESRADDTDAQAPS